MFICPLSMDWMQAAGWLAGWLVGWVARLELAEAACLPLVWLAGWLELAGAGGGWLACAVWDWLATWLAGWR